MSVLDNSETVADAIRPTLDKFANAAEPTIRKVAEELYEQLLYATQDYLRENGEWNIGAEIDRCRKIERDNIQLRILRDDMVQALEHLDGFLANKGYSESDPLVRGMARSAIAKARGQ